MKHPVIVLIDNDDGATQIFKLLQSKKFGVTIGHATDLPFYHLGGHLYLVKTPIKGPDNQSCPEDLFDPALLATKIDGKTFNPDKEHDAPGEFGKVVFAERVVRPQAGTIDFSGFDPLLTRIDAVLDDYAKRPAPVPSPAAPAASAPTKKKRAKAAAAVAAP
jgi:RNA-directed DNA polymerase